MKLIRQILCLLLALLVLAPGTPLASADAATDKDAPNGMTVVLPDAAPRPKRESSGAPFVYYTLSGNGQLIENYYDETGSLRYAFGNITELYPDTVWPTPVSPYPVSNGFGFVMVEVDETGSMQTLRNFSTDGGVAALPLSISYEEYGRKVYYLPEDTTVSLDGTTVTRLAMTEKVYYGIMTDHRPVNVQRYSGDRLIFIGEYYYDGDDADAKFVSAWEQNQYDTKEGAERSVSYNFFYSDGILDTVDVSRYSPEDSLTQQQMTFSFANGKRKEIRITTEGSASEERYSYTYDDQGQLIAIEHSVDGVLTDSMDMVYDVDGRLAQFLSYTYFDGTQGVRTGRPRIDARYSYDEKGFLAVMEYETWLKNDTMDGDRQVFTFLRNGDGSLRAVKQSGLEDEPLEESYGFVTLTFPEHWRGKYLVETPDVGVVSVYNRANREAGHDGHLFTIYATTRVHSNMQLLDFSIDRDFQNENYSGAIGCYHLCNWDRGVVFALTDGNYSFDHTNADLTLDYLQMFGDVTTVLHMCRIDEGELANIADRLETIEREHPEYPGYPTGWVEPPALPAGVS